MFIRKTRSMPTADTALPGRDEEVSISGIHFVNDSNMKPPFPDGSEVLYVGMGCFWGAERIFWKLPGVITTAAEVEHRHTNRRQLGLDVHGEDLSQPVRKHLWLHGRDQL